MDIGYANSSQGSYAPNTTGKPLYEKKCKSEALSKLFLAVINRYFSTYSVHKEEAPSGMFARDRYSAVSKFVDDDNKTHLQFEWSFTISKDW
jgi:Rho GDP-dissociation inhibitor